MAENIIPIDLGFVNAYLVRNGERFVLVDTGLSSQWQKLTNGLAAAGCTPGKLALVILTHCDQDHAGNALRLKQEWKTPIAAHAADARTLETGKAPKRHVRGLLLTILIGMMDLLHKAKKNVSMTPTFTPDILLRDGQRLDAWGLDARILHLPGHTQGSIAILTAQGSLIAGDVFSNRRRPSTAPFIENIEAYRGSLAKAKELVPQVKTVYPGHGPSFPGSAIAGIEL